MSIADVWWQILILMIAFGTNSDHMVLTQNARKLHNYTYWMHKHSIHSIHVRSICVPGCVSMYNIIRVKCGTHSNAYQTI